MNDKEKLVEIELECQRVLIERKHKFEIIGTEDLAEKIIEIINKKTV